MGFRRRIKWYAGLLIVVAFSAPAEAQWTQQQSGTRASLRGLSVVNERVVWASGSRGTFLRTVDGGATWQADTVAGATALDFRDIQAFDENRAVLLSSGDGNVRVYRTTDGGRSWSLAYEKRAPGVFFDGMAFRDQQNGVAFGDPIDGKFQLLVTRDGGATWNEHMPATLPAAQQGEAAFAASGTGIVALGRGHAWFGTGGGAKTRVFHSADHGATWQTVDVPMAAGEGASGIYSLAFADTLRGVAVGGNYTQAASPNGNAAVTTDGGKTWTPVTGQPPRGYRSGVAFLPGTAGPTLIAVGPTGSDISDDAGRSWRALGDVGFNAVAFASARVGWAVGENGRVARYERGE